MRQAVLRFILRNPWLVAAVIFEVLGLLAAFGSIPNLPVPTAWMLALTGILSCIGVVIVTVYFMFQYNRRPLNVFQKDEIERMLSEYTPSEAIRETFIQKAPNDKEFAIFWMWRYQKSMMEFAWASRQLGNAKGYVLVGELYGQGPLARIVYHSVLPPPFSNVGDSLSNDGESLPEGNYMNWQSLFTEGFPLFRKQVILYKASDRRIKVLHVDGSQKVVFSVERASPMLLDADAGTGLPTLASFQDVEGNFHWQWVPGVSSNS